MMTLAAFVTVPLKMNVKNSLVTIQQVSGRKAVQEAVYYSAVDSPIVIHN